MDSRGLNSFECSAYSLEKKEQLHGIYMVEFIRFIKVKAGAKQISFLGICQQIPAISHLKIDSCLNRFSDSNYFAVNLSNSYYFERNSFPKKFIPSPFVMLLIEHVFSVSTGHVKEQYSHLVYAKIYMKYNKPVKAWAQFGHRGCKRIVKDAQ